MKCENFLSFTNKRSHRQDDDSVRHHLNSRSSCEPFEWNVAGDHESHVDRSDALCQPEAHRDVQNPVVASGEQQTRSGDDQHQQRVAVHDSRRLFEVIADERRRKATENVHNGERRHERRNLVRAVVELMEDERREEREVDLGEDGDGDADHHVQIDFIAQQSQVEDPHEPHPPVADSVVPSTAF